VPLLDTSRLPAGFQEATLEANGITLNYARGGTGPALVLLHGYPQTWYMWRKVMPTLAEQFTVIAPDLRGSGGSEAPASGYDKATLADDIHELLLALGLADEVSLVGHDIGTLVAYTYASAHRDTTRHLVVIDAPLPDKSIYQFPSIMPSGPGLWNFGFFTLENGLPEQMLAGREETWVRGFVDWMEVIKGGVGDEAIAEYAAQLQRPGHTRASFQYFHTLHADIAHTTEHRGEPLTMPVLAIGAEATLGDMVRAQLTTFASDVTGSIAPTGHWVPEENPDYLIAQLLEFFSAHAAPTAPRSSNTTPATSSSP
jgi:pimeloyl-ACP methyl ester carboxylesterase